MTATAHIALLPRSVLLVPRAAIVTSGDGREVFVAKDGRAQSKPVVLGREFQTAVEVREGLTEGELVITKGLARVRSGRPITLAASTLP